MSATPQVNKIDAFEPLPAVGEPTAGRWAAPYLAGKTGLWTVHLRRPLTRRQIDSGLVDTISASTLEALEAAMERQDEAAGKLNASPDPAPTWSHKA
ncbi:hypothetical protein [Spirillospora sp. NPDC048819]|uniref:hypothetical protein n=1 Tax=Spirillospora sp. NPDC048819 TaxID=3155268 RepID=UPI0033D31F47